MTVFVCLMEDSEFGKHGKHYFDTAKSILDARPNDFVQKVGVTEPPPSRSAMRERALTVKDAAVTGAPVRPSPNTRQESVLR